MLVYHTTVVRVVICGSDAVIETKPGHSAKAPCAGLKHSPAPCQHFSAKVSAIWTHALIKQ